MTTPKPQFIDGRLVRHYGVFEVQLQLADERGTSRRIVANCTAVDRPYNKGQSPTLLGMPILSQAGMLLFPQNLSWWFATVLGGDSRYFRHFVV